MFCHKLHNHTAGPNPPGRWFELHTIQPKDHLRPVRDMDGERHHQMLPCYRWLKPINEYMYIHYMLRQYSMCVLEWETPWVGFLSYINGSAKKRRKEWMKKVEVQSSLGRNGCVICEKMSFFPGSYVCAKRPWMVMLWGRQLGTVCMLKQGSSLTLFFQKTKSPPHRENSTGSSQNIYLPHI